MKKLLVAFLFLAILPLFAGDYPKNIPDRGPERRAALEKIYGRVAFEKDPNIANYKIAFVDDIGEADIRVAFSENPWETGLWQQVSSGSLFVDFTVCIVDPEDADFLIKIVRSGEQGVPL